MGKSIFDYNYYKIEYLSSCLDESQDKKTTIIRSEQDLKIGDTIVVEKMGQGLFLGRVIENFDKSQGVPKTCFYCYIQSIDLSKYFEKIDNAKKRAILEEQMEAAYAEIDKISKWEYYAERDNKFKQMLDEYKRLG